MSTTGWNETIKALKNEEQVRQRPQPIFGTNDEHGYVSGISEILANAFDEIREGYGDTVKMEMKLDGTVIITDNGRGVPMGWNEVEEKYNWELVFCTLYASGKLDASSYKTALGLNGLGATAMQYASEYMVVESVYDGKKHTMRFELGKPVKELEIVAAGDASSGTRIEFKPDLTVFKAARFRQVPVETFALKLQRQAMLNDVTVVYEYEGYPEVVLKYDEGMKGYIDQICEKPMISTMYFERKSICNDDNGGEDYNLNTRIALNFSRNESGIDLYHNGALLPEGGSSLDGFKKGMTQAFEEVLKIRGDISKQDKVIFSDISDILLAVGETTAAGFVINFKHQTKVAIGNRGIERAVNALVYDTMRNWLDINADADRVIAEVLANKQAREEAERISKKVISSLNKGISGIGSKPNKFVDCGKVNVSDKELYIVEGDSAKGSVVLGRNSKFQAVMPLRGKILNCLKESVSRCISSTIIVDLLRVLGCGVEVDGEDAMADKLPQFDIKKLNWGKVIICTDADVDGMQIRCLILAMIYRLCPSLIREGKVYIVESPLYEIEMRGRSGSIFAYTDSEKDDVIKKIVEAGGKEKDISISRSKGLGENTPEMMNKTTMDPKTRRLVHVEYADDAEASRLIHSLLGSDIEARKQIIEKYFAEVDVDIFE